MKKGFIPTIVVMIVALMASVSVLSAAKNVTTSVKGVKSYASEKARYYYVEGSVALAEGRPSEAYELFKKAAKTDPDYSEAVYSYALMRMSLRNDTLSTPQEVAKSIAMMRPYIDRYPGETAESMNYSYLAARSGDLDEAVRVAERSDTMSSGQSAILLQLAHYYTLKQDADKAIRTLERYERIEGPDPDLALRRFGLMYGKGDTLKLLSESERLVRENPVSTEFLVIRGNVFEALQMPDSALLCYEKAETLDPEDGRVKLVMANFFLERGDSVAYDEKSSEALLSENIDLEQKLDMMKHYMQNIISDSTADHRRATRLFDGLLRQYPHEPEVLDLGGQFYAAVEDYSRAQELMSYATDLEPENPDYWLRLAHFYFSDRKYDESADVCERAIEKLPEVPDALYLVYATSLSLMEDYDKARGAYQKMLDAVLPGALISDDAATMLQKAARLSYNELMGVADIFQMVGDGSFKTGDLERSMKEYEVALALNPESTMAMNNYAYYLALGGGDLDKAEELSRKTVTEQPENPTFLDTLAWILYLKGDYSEALELQEKAFENITPEAAESGEYWDHLGDIQFRNGLKEKALESWKNALKLDKDNKKIAEKVRLKKIVEND